VFRVADVERSSFSACKPGFDLFVDALGFLISHNSMASPEKIFTVIAILFCLPGKFRLLRAVSQLRALQNEREKRNKRQEVNGWSDHTDIEMAQ
jgi:hypothetical protein